MTEDMIPELDNFWRETDNYFENGKYEKAIEIYRYMVIRYGDKNTANEYANASLGEILLMLGQTELGQNHISKAVSYNPENPHYHFLLGFVYYTRYEWENAIKQYKLALDKEPWNREYMHALAVAVFNYGDKEMGIRSDIEP
jgi:tetratricopeptide (TPR) repeat protein